MMQQIKIKNNQECAVIDIEGTIGVPEEWQFDDPQQRVATYERFRSSLASIEALQTPSVVVNIRSTGGDVNDALLIYDALTTLDAEITTRCWGYVASAATIIAQAASDGLREISPNALYLVHCSTCSAEGNTNDLAQRAELLRKSDERIAELYARRSGRDVSTFEELMNEDAGEGRWLNASETIEAGLADCEIEAQSVGHKVSETIENALSSVKGMIRRLGEQITGSESVVDAAPQEAVEQPQTQSQVVFEEVQRQLAPSVVEPIEDPSLMEQKMSANDSAYQNDARRFRSRY